MLLFGNHLIGQNTAFYTDAEKSYSEGIEFLSEGLFGLAQKKFQESAALVSTLEEYHPKLIGIKSELLAAHCAVLLDKPDAKGKLEDYIKQHRPDPFVNMALLEIGDYYFKKKEYREAIRYYDFLALDELDELRASEAGFKSGYSSFVQKDFNKAIERLEPVSDYKNEYYYPVNYYLGLSHYYLESYEEAAVYLERVNISKTYKPYIPHLLTQINFNLGNYDEVIFRGERALQLDDVKNRTEIHGLLGRVYYERKAYDQALPHLEYFVNEAKDPSAEDRYQLAYIYYANDQFAKAEEVFKTLSNEEGQLGQNANFYLGVSLFQQGEKEQARNAFAIAKRIDHDPEISLEAQFLYGVMSADMGYDREAVNALVDIPTTASYYRDAQSTLAWVFNRTEDLDQAIAILESRQLVTPELKQAYQRVTYLKGLQYYQADELEKAGALWNQSLNYPIDPTIQTQTLFWLGELAHATGDFRASIDYYNRYFTAYEESMVLPSTQRSYVGRYNQGYNYLRLQDYGLASGQFQEAVSAIKENYATSVDPYIRQQLLSDATIRAADCLFKRNLYDRALIFYNEAINKKHTGFDYALYQSAMIYGLKNDKWEKLLRLEKVFELEPESAYRDDALYEAANTYIELNQATEAIKPFETIVEDYGANSEFTIQSLFKLGLVAYNAGDTRRALEYYKNIFNYQADAGERRDALAAIEEIYLTDLNDPEGYLSYLEGSGNANLSELQRDSINFKSAHIAYLDGNYDKAIEGFDGYLAKFPQGIHSTEALYKRGESKGVKENFREAYEDYRAVVDRGPSEFYGSAVEKAAKIAYNVIEDFDVSASLYEKWLEVEKKPESRLEGNIGLMRSAMNIRDYDLTKSAAVGVIENALATEQDRLLARFYLGKCAYVEKGFETAIPALNESSANEGAIEAAEARFMIADIYYTQQEYTLASDMARNAVQKNSAHPYWVAKSLILLADISVAQGDILQARAALEAIIENFKADDEIVKMAESRLAQIKAMEKKDTSGLLEMDEQEPDE
jgi:tetratricopeptide (TPR) repeat protein